jgi:hypothetical protein
MRKIATDAVEKVFGYLLTEEEDELVTSVVRQWITCDGHAVLMKEEERFYLIFGQKDDGFTLTINHVEGDVLGRFLRDWHIDPDETPEIVHRLNLCQSAEVTNRQGLPLRFSTDPKSRTIRIDDLSAPPKPEGEEPSLPPAADAQHERPVAALGLEPERKMPSLPPATPLFCPYCCAVLRSWRRGQSEQQCPLCHRAVRI